jgi:hypothetical protein
VAQFQATAGDLDELIRLAQRTELRNGVTYPAVALAVAALLSVFFLEGALVSLGMALAWGLSAYWSIRGVRNAYLWRYAWLQEPVVVELSEEGVTLSGARGTTLFRWDGGMVVRSRGSYFILEDEGEDFVVLPKRYLDSTELIVLQSRAA